MKLTTTLNKLPLIALLSVGLVYTPLVVSAGDSGHDRHSDYQQDRDTHHSKTARYRGYRDYSYQQSCCHGNSYRKARKHGYVSGHHPLRRHGPHDNDASFQRYQWGGHNDHPLFLLGLMPDD
jgi:hypothetical protein